MPGTLQDTLFTYSRAGIRGFIQACPNGKTCCLSGTSAIGLSTPVGTRIF